MRSISQAHCVAGLLFLLAIFRYPNWQRCLTIWHVSWYKYVQAMSDVTTPTRRGGARPLPGGRYRTTINLAGEQMPALERMMDKTGLDMGKIIRRALDRELALFLDSEAIENGTIWQGARLPEATSGTPAERPEVRAEGAGVSEERELWMDDLPSAQALRPVPVPTPDQLAALMSHALDTAWELRRLAEDTIYGYPLVDDPRDYTPDHEVCSPEEVAEWERACVWAEGGHVIPAPPAHEPTHAKGEDGEVRQVGHITRAPWGIGVSTIRDERAMAVYAALVKAIRDIDPAHPWWEQPR